MTENKQFENRLNKDIKKFHTLNPVWDNEKQDALNIFEMIDLLNELNEKNQKLIEKDCYNCKNCETYDEGDEYGFVSLCKKDCMNTDGYFDYKYHRFKKPCICPFWEEDENDF